jgi:hypothetical protein
VSRDQTRQGHCSLKEAENYGNTDSQTTINSRQTNANGSSEIRQAQGNGYEQYTRHGIKLSRTGRGTRITSP